jgi:hypothetical protein
MAEHVLAGLLLAMAGLWHWARIPLGHVEREDLDPSPGLLHAARYLRHLCHWAWRVRGCDAYRQAAQRCTGVIAALEGAIVEERL